MTFIISDSMSYNGVKNVLNRCIPLSTLDDFSGMMLLQSDGRGGSTKSQ